MFASILAGPESPFPMGHEFTGQVSQVGKDVKKLKEGDRVAFLPLATCEAYGFKLCSSCRNGNFAGCYTYVGVGDGSELEKRYGGEGGFGGVGGGGYSEYAFGFEKQFFPVPKNVPDEIAVLTEPFSIGVHAVARNMPSHDDSVIVIGAGTIGLMLVAAIRCLGVRCRIITIARYPFQAKAAKTLGSDETIVERDTDRLYERIIGITGGRLFKPVMGKRGVFGNTGPDIIFDCVGTESSLNDALHIIRSNGKIIIVGENYSITKSVDWALQTYKEVDIVGSNAYGLESFKGQKIHSFELALDCMQKNPEIFRGLVTHTFRIEDYRKAFKCATDKKSNQVIKPAFDYRS
jgi:threonine dehydrogenase-like Zn-dependent dehydrogenase